MQARQAWWQTEVHCPIYPFGFADSNRDGTGDLPGITSRIDHPVALGGFDARVAAFQAWGAMPVMGLEVPKSGEFGSLIIVI